MPHRPTFSPFRLRLPALLVLLALAGALPVHGGEDAAKAEDPLARYEGGTPVPRTAGTVSFPWFGKQSVLCVGEAFERQVAFVDFSADGGIEIGSATLKEDGSGSARFNVPVASLRTGHEDRDTKLQGGLWLDAEKHPEIVFEATRLERVRPTVWKIDGTWTMKGVSKPVSFHANVRYLEEMRNVGKDVVRMKASFPIRLRDHGVGGEYVGTDAVAEVWDVQLVLLGTLERSE